VVRLSSFAALEPTSFSELLALLGVALEAPAEGGVRRACSIDGRVEVELMPPSDNDVAVLTTEHGTLRAPDFQVSITVIGAAAASHDQEAIVA